MTQPPWWKPVITRLDHAGCLSEIKGALGAALVGGAIWYVPIRFWVGAVALWLITRSIARALFAIRPRPGTHKRPIGRMVFATIVSLYLALVLFFAVVFLGDQDWIDVGASDMAIDITAIALGITQGIVHPAYAWWRWLRAPKHG